MASEVAVPAPVGMLRGYASAIEQMLPAHLPPDAFIRIAEAALRKSPDLMAAAVRRPDTFLSACMDAARLGHQPGSDRYALTVRGKGDKAVVMGMEQYQGVIDRMYRSGAVLAVRANVVREGDGFEWDGHGVPHHRADWLAGDDRRGPLVGVYAYALLDTGTNSRVVVMNRDEVMRHREVAATTMIWDGPFQPSMWLKTGCHELEKWVPCSVEYRMQAARAAAVVAAQPLPPPVPSVVYPATVEPVETPTAGGPVIDADPGDDWPEPAKPGGAR